MRSLFRLLIKNYPFLLFLVLEVISVVFIINYNSFQRASFLNSSNAVTASIFNAYSAVSQYFSLASVNAELAEENARLQNAIGAYQNSVIDSINLINSKDTTFRYIPARVINNSVNRQQNYITLNKGRKDGIKPDQGIVSPNGIVGIVTNVSESYAMGLSVLNPRWSVSAKLKKNGFYGSLVWKGEDYQRAQLDEIPFHITLQVGDTIVTSGYSSVFPDGILIGTIDTFNRPEGENYYTISVLLAADFKSITYVEVIENNKIDELRTLKNTTEHGTLGN
jgi:rod shape-determining protein MreC